MHNKGFYILAICTIILIFGGIGFEQCFILAKQVLSTEPHLQFILLWLFWRWGLMNYLLGLTLNFDLPGLSLPGTLYICTKNSMMKPNKNY
jgi:Trk-type K+ transport system membrane component